MKKVIILIAMLLIAIPSIALPEQVSQYSRALRVRDGQVIPFSSMAGEISNSDVILVGESHGSMANHKAQLDIINMLHVSNIPISIGLEMFMANDQKELDRWVEGITTQDKFIKIFNNNWSAPWSLYENIFLYAREHRIPMVGLNVPERITKKVFESGFDSLSTDDRREIPPGISCTVDMEYKRFINEMYAFHRSMSGQSFSNFCEAQMLWDSVMAWYIIDRLNNTHRMKMVALVGVVHAWKKGVADQIKKRSNYRCIVILPNVPSGKKRQDITANDADYLLLD